MTKNKTLKREAIKQLWRLGHLSHKLHSGQKDLYELYYNSDHKIQTWLISRRFGKTFTLCILALEQCIRQPNSIVKFLAATKIQITNIVRPLFNEILEDCPQEIKPELRQKDYIYYFPNGSEIQLAGSEGGHAERLRGGNSHIAFIDEARDCSDLDNIVKSILLPTTLMTNGKIILASTPPKDPDHDFIHFIEEAELRGSLIKKTIEEAPHISEERKQEIFAETGGIDSEVTRREYFCEIIKDSKTTVIPEFTKDIMHEIVQSWKMPPHYDMYEGMDLGGKDLTVNLLGYYDFRNNKVVIEDEVVINFQEKNVTIKTLVDKIKASEEKYFFNHLTNEQKKPTKRVSDIDYIVIKEINEVSKFEVKFEPVKKDNLEAMINFLREKIKKREIVINPRCVTLIRHLSNAKWKKGDSVMLARSPDDGHYDSLMSLVYLIRSIDYRKNPYPAHYGLNTRSLHVQNEQKFYEKRDTEVFRKIFNIKRK